MINPIDILNTPFDEVKPPPPILLPQRSSARHPDAIVLRVYQTLDDAREVGLGKWAPPCGGPFELLVQFKRNNVLFYKLRCQTCGRGHGHIAYDSIPPDVRVRKGDEVPEPSKFANEW
jgi:hypothetical protein